MNKARNILCLLFSTGVLFGGCRSGATAARHEPSQVGPQQSGAALTEVSHSEEGLIPYFHEEQSVVRTFRQTDLGRREGKSRTYERAVQPEGRVEGSLVGRVEFPLSRYLDPHSQRERRPMVQWPTANDRRVDAFFVGLDPPLMEWPVAAGVGEEVDSRAKVTAYEWDGMPFAYGNVRRTMRVVGYESLRVGGQVFDDAVRMEAQSELTFGWLATIRVIETAWFARGAGLVRREERFNGRALWLFRFGGASKYELAEEVEPRVQMVAQRQRGRLAGEIQTDDELAALSPGDEDLSRSSAKMWSSIAICFDRTGRRLQVSGLAVDWTDSRE